MVTLDGEDEMDDAELDSYLSSADEELEEVTVQEVEMEDRRTTVPRDAGDNASIDGEPIQEDDVDNSPQRARKRSCDELEEQEAKRLQTKARDAMADDDFGLGDIVEGAPEADGYAARCMHVCACSSLTVLQTRRRTRAPSSAAAAARQAFSAAASGEDEPGSTGVGP